MDSWEKSFVKRHYKFLLFSIALILAVFYLGVYEEKEFIGVINDFEISTGGFGSRTHCTIELESGRKLVSNSGCSSLYTGGELYKWKRKLGDEIYRVK